MWKLFVLTFSIINFSYGQNLLEDPPVVETDLGKIEGTWQRHLFGREYASFEGIPFAKAPIGKLRFKNPQPVDPWNKTLKATKPYICIQSGLLGNKGEEDCLYLNIYVPKILLDPTNSTDVIVHIHGGGFKAGSGTSYAHPGFLMEKDVVFVTINYRLSVFGFLSTEDEVIPGNFGMKDQVMALRFVQNHIHRFGGNKNSVTITGISAGAVSVHLHYFSALSANLFHRGISQSGSAIDCWAIQENARERALVVGRSVGCPQNSSASLLECLQSKPMMDIFNKSNELELPYGLPLPNFGPVLESNKSVDPFLTRHPYELLQEGRVQNLSWVASTTAEEGIFIVKFFIDDLTTVSRNWTPLAPDLLDFTASLAPDQHASTAKKIRDFYVPGNEEFSEATARKLARMFSDRLFLVSGEQAARMQAQNGMVHSYSLRYNGSLSFSKLLPSKIPLVGPTHGEDVFYQYPQPLLPLIPEKDRELKDLYVDFVVNYAKTGVPKFGNQTWNPVKSDELDILILNSPDDIQLKKVDHLAPVQFWDSLGLAKNEK